jgi:hypothetical protein
MCRVWVWVLLVAGCGGQCPEATSASSAPAAAEGASASLAGGGAEGNGEKSEEPAEKPARSQGETHPAEADSKPSDVAANPTFPENASVAQAIAAVPTGTTRANIDPETLGMPLQSEALYEPCKVGAQHFKVRVAVWNGHAVGVDVTAPNTALAACIDKRVRGIEWRDKVRSLNTVDYSM